MTLLGIILFIVVFSIIYFFLDGVHDSWVNKEKQAYGAYRYLRGKISSGKSDNSNTVEQWKVQMAYYLNKGKKYATRWHFMDSIIKGFVVACLSFAFVGFSWWIPIFFFTAFSIRWFWFDLVWNWFSGMNPWYIGNTASTDKLSKNQWLMVGIKIVLILISIGLIIWNYNVIPL